MSIRFLPKVLWRSLKFSEAHNNGDDSMADEKNETLEESKWWIDRGPVKEREKPLGPVPGIIEKWAYELLRGYNQDQAAKNLVDINSRLLKELTVASGEWGYFSMDVGTYPPEKLAKIKNGLPLPAGARGLIVDFTDAPALDYWVDGQLVRERVFSNVGEALKRIRADLPKYLKNTE
jgi:hypothetical protein